MVDELGDPTVSCLPTVHTKHRISLQATVKQLFNFKVNKRTSEFARWHVYLCLCVFLFCKARDLVSLSVENQKLLKDFCSSLFAPDL